jgi:colanic acid/amylovoran biosynthesis protein
MRFSIEGYYPGNFGDVLMAGATIKLAETAVPNSRFFLPQRIPLPRDLVANPSRQIVWEKPNTQRLFFFGRRPNIGRSNRISETARSRSRTVVLYCCGYIFGDFWPVEWIEDLGRDLAALRRRGNKIVLMPQSFGPFEKPHIRQACLRALENVDLICARDEQSCRYVNDLSPDLPVTVSSDFTGVLRERDEAVTPQNRLCVVPNIKILERHGEGAKGPYFQLIFSICESVAKSRGCSIAILRHTAAQDDSVAAELAAFLAPLQAQFVDSPACYDARQFIAESRFVLSSRFHGLVNGLAHGVPCLAIGWTHKYDGILEIYDQKKYSLRAGSAEWDATVECFLKSEKDIRNTLRERQGSIEESIYAKLRQRIRDVARGPVSR